MRRAVDLTQIALHAIWGNKLRSTLTILGNIVSVGSIIAVVSLIQGVNDEVAGAIVSQFGSDSFRVSRTGLLMSRGGRGGGPQQPAHFSRRCRGHPQLRLGTSAR